MKNALGEGSLEEASGGGSGGRKQWAFVTVGGWLECYEVVRSSRGRRSRLRGRDSVNSGG